MEDERTPLVVETVDASAAGEHACDQFRPNQGDQESQTQDGERPKAFKDLLLVVRVRVVFYDYCHIKPISSRLS
jgi:hypothetical protein